MSFCSRHLAALRQGNRFREGRSVGKNASQTALGGLGNERDVIAAFNSWSGQTNGHAAEWLQAMGHDLASVKSVTAENIRSQVKPDITVRVVGRKAAVHKVSVKLISSAGTTNSIARATIGNFQSFFSPPADVLELISLYTGAISPDGRKGLSDRRRVKAHELTPEEQQTVVRWLNSKSHKIVDWASPRH